MNKSLLSVGVAGVHSMRHRRYIHVEVLQQRAQHLALGYNEALVEFALHTLKVFAAKHAGSKPIDVLAQSFKRERCTGVGAALSANIVETPATLGISGRRWR